MDKYLFIVFNYGYLLIFKEKWPNDATVPKSALTLLTFCPNNRKCTEKLDERMEYCKASRGSHFNNVVFNF